MAGWLFVLTALGVLLGLLLFITEPGAIGRIPFHGLMITTAILFTGGCICARLEDIHSLLEKEDDDA
jgi:hypothetical protein